MFRVSFNDGWEFRPKVSSFAELGRGGAPWRPVTLPHDAMIGQQRVAPDGGSADGGANAYFPGGVFEYRKTFRVPEEDRGRRILVEFEGVYRDAMVYVNGNYAGQRPYGYSLFRVDAGRFLRFGADNEIRVEARAHKDSRWYTGAGIYRDTWLLTGALVRIAPDGVRVTTPDTDTERAVIEVATRVDNDSIAIRTPRLVTEIRDAAGTVVAADACQVSVLPGAPAIARQRLYVRAPDLWSADSPALNSARVTLTGEEGEEDTETVTFGIRSLRLDPEHGLRINGETVKLRGACVHHDNGVLGAATYARAEERRVQILKDAGFNAIRMAHHPMSTAMLNACDRLGHAGHGRGVRHVDLGQERLRLQPGLPAVVGTRHRGDGRQGRQPPQRHRLLHRQRDPGDRIARRGGLGTQARREGPRPGPRPLRHQRDQRDARRARRPGRDARRSRARTASTP